MFERHTLPLGKNAFLRCRLGVVLGSLPLDGGRRLRGDVVHNSVHRLHLIADAVGAPLKKVGLKWVPGEVTATISSAVLEFK